MRKTLVNVFAAKIVLYVKVTRRRKQSMKTHEKKVPQSDESSQISDAESEGWPVSPE